MKKGSQTAIVLDFMQANKGITTIEAFDLGITRLASRIHELRGMGFKIINEQVTGTNRYGHTFHCVRYKLA